MAWRIANSIIMSTPWAAVPDINPLHGLQASGLQERGNSHRHWMEQCFAHTEKRQKTSKSVSSPWTEGLLLQPSKGCSACIYSSLLETVTAVGLAGCCMMHTCKENREAHIKSTREKGIPQNMPSTSCKCSLFLCKEMLLSQSTLLCDHTYVPRLCSQDCFPQQILIWKKHT